MFPRESREADELPQAGPGAPLAVRGTVWICGATGGMFDMIT